MKKEKKIIISILILLVLAGCGKKAEESTKISEKDDYVYLAEYQFIYPDGYNPYKSIIGGDGTLYFAGYKKETGTKFFLMEPGEKETKEIPLGINCENMWISAMCIDRSGSLLMVCSRYGETLEQLDVVKMSANGSISEVIDLTETFKDIPNFEAMDIAADEEGNCYITSGKSVYVLSEDLKLQEELNAEHEIGDMFLSKEGDVVIVDFNSKQLQKVDSTKKKLRPVKSNISYSHGIYQAGSEKDIMYSQGNILYACDIKDEAAAEVLNWLDNDIDSRNLDSFAILDDGRIAALSVGSGFVGNETSEFILLNKTERAEVPEKTILTYGHAFYNSTTSAQILRFNKLSKEYRIEMKQYGDDQTDLETQRMMIQTDIITGELPDIIDIGLLFSPEDHYEFIEMGIFENLNPFFEKDEKVSREDYLENVLSVYEKNNELYAVMPSFMLRFLAGKESVIGDRDSWTMKEMMTFAEDKPKNTLLPDMCRSDILLLLLKLNMEEFIDWETGECRFDGEEFKQLLMFATLFPSKKEENFYLYQKWEQLRNDEILLLETGAISMLDFQSLAFLFGEPVNSIGYPTNNKKGTTAVPCVSVIAMSKGSKNKAGAWEFIRFLLEDKQQEEIGISGMQGFPINKAALERVFEKSMQAEYYEDEDGVMREDSKLKRQITEEVTIDIYASTKEDVARAKELINSVGNNMDAGAEKKLFEIITEEAEAFFEGQKTVDEVTDLINSRVQIYVDEKK